MTDLREADAEAPLWDLPWVRWMESVSPDWKGAPIDLAQLAYGAGYDAGRATEAARYRGLREAAAGAANWLETYGRTESEAALSSSLRAALAENPAPARPERDITKPPIVVGIDAEDEEWMNAPLGTPRPTEYDTLLRQYRELEAKAGDDALRTRLTDEAMVARVAEAMLAAAPYTPPGVSPSMWRTLARAALAVIAEPNDVNSTDRG